MGGGRPTHKTVKLAKARDISIVDCYPGLDHVIIYRGKKGKCYRNPIKRFEELMNICRVHTFAPPGGVDPSVLQWSIANPVRISPSRTIEHFLPTVVINVDELFLWTWVLWTWVKHRFELWCLNFQSILTTATYTIRMDTELQPGRGCSIVTEPTISGNEP